MEHEWLFGFVLHARPYRETSQLIDIFTREQGRVALVAKGVRSGRHDKKGLLQLFHPLRLQCKGKSSLQNLLQMESAGASVTLRGEALFCAMYVNELLTRVLPEGFVADALFDSYVVTLEQLSESAPQARVLRQFEYQLLLELGVLPDCSFEQNGVSPIEQEHYYQLVSEQGFVRIEVNETRADVFSGAVILAYAQQQWSVATLTLAKYLHRYLLKQILGSKPLKSRELFRRR